VIILRAKQPFLDWARALDDGDRDLTLEALSEDNTAYLVPVIWYDYDRQPMIEWCYDILFEEQLYAWWTDKAAWPKKRDLKTFLEWFEVEFHSMVLDLCDEPIGAVGAEEINPPDDGNPPTDV
jgi:hypothetical protein